MTTFNSGKTVEAAVQSVMEQDYPHVELLVVDDASTDNTSEVIRGLMKKYKDHRYKFSFMQNPTNVGTYVSKNRAIQAALGDYITGHDSDDTAEKNYVTELMKPHIEQRQGVKITAVECASRHGAKRADGSPRTVFCCISQCFSKELVSEIGYFDSVRFAADSEFYKRCRKIFGTHSVLKIKKLLYNVVRTQTSLTGNSKTGMYSKPRKYYVSQYTKWHNTTTREALSKAFRKFPLKLRPFPVHDESVRGLPRVRQPARLNPWNQRFKNKLNKPTNK
jgi:glycosyltransferase involved in cell wall biosynthesis